MFRKLVNRSALLRTVVKTPPAQASIQAVRGARAVVNPGRFIAQELLGGTRTHTLRAGPRVVIRHRTRDVHILSEIFGGAGGRKAYEPPVDAPADAVQRILDLGGNIGLFGAYALSRWPSASIDAYEPDDDNAAIHEQTVAANGAQDRWRIHRAAISNRDGVLRFTSGRFSESRAARDGEAAVDVPMLDLFDRCDADLIKMDIEGGEWPILEDPRMSALPARLIVMEWHAAGCPRPCAREAVLDGLKRAGYSHVRELSRHAHNGQLWAWR